MSRLLLQVWMATVVLSAGLAIVPAVAAGRTQTFTEGSATPCAAPSTGRGRPCDLCSCLRAERCQVRFGSRRQGLYP